MGRVKEMWQDQLDLIGARYSAGEVTFQEAMARLIALGLDPHDAANHLEHAKETS